VILADFKPVGVLDEELSDRIEELSEILLDGVDKPWPIDFETLKVNPVLPSFDSQGLDIHAPAPKPLLPARPGWLHRLIPGVDAKWAEECNAALVTHAHSLRMHAAGEEAKHTQLPAKRAHFEAELAQLESDAARYNIEIDRFRAHLVAGEEAAIRRYFSLVLQCDEIPEGFPRNHNVAFIKESKQLIVERMLPLADIVPSELTFRYVRARDEITSTARPIAQIRRLYELIVAQMVLRTVVGIFASDEFGIVESMVTNGYVDTIDPATGKPVRPCLLTVRVTRDMFDEVDFSRVEPLACLKSFGAQISRSPQELLPVRPIVDFNMVDPRFVDKPQVLARLESRPNLAELSPGEFEALITNLFEKMGLETRLTQASRDGGVDCVAWDMRPIVGGKVIVQAKRYRNTVGVSAVRDLYGTVMNEGAAKGILVATSGYGKAAYDFVKNKPLELLSGSNLLHLLEEHAGIKARIEFPDEWQDPQP
jgi:restriction system protein